MMTFIQATKEEINNLDSMASSEESVLMMILIQVNTEDVSEDSEASSEESGSDGSYLGED